MANTKVSRELAKRIKAYIRQHWDTDDMDTEEITDVAQQSVEWLTDRGYTGHHDVAKSDIAEALNHVTLY